MSRRFLDIISEEGKLIMTGALDLTPIIRPEKFK